MVRNFHRNQELVSVFFPVTTCKTPNTSKEMYFFFNNSLGTAMWQGTNLINKRFSSYDSSRNERQMRGFLANLLLLYLS